MKKIGIFVILALVSAAFAASGISGLSQVSSAMSALCVGLTQMLPVAGMLMIILSGVIYASGQMMGAETRARANTWATAAVTGAMMAILISVISPSVIGAVYGSEVSCTSTPSSSTPSSCLNDKGVVVCSYDSGTQQCCCSGASDAYCKAKGQGCTCS